MQYHVRLTNCKKGNIKRERERERKYCHHFSPETDVHWWAPYAS